MKKILYKSYKILESKNKIFLVYILITTFLMLVLDIAGIGLVFPLLTSLVSENYMDSKFYYYLNTIFEFQSKKDFLYFLIFSIISIFIFKNIALFFFFFCKDRFTGNLTDNLKLKYYVNYLNQDLSFHTKTNSARLITNLDSEINLFTRGVLLASTNIILEVFTITIVFILLVFINFKLTISALSVIFLLMVTILFFTKHRLNVLGQIRSKYVVKNMKIKQQSFNSIRDIKINFLEKILSKSFFQILKRLRQVKIQGNLIALFPKIIFETVTILALCFFLIYALNNNYDLVSFIPTLGVFFLSALRFVPSVNKTINYINNMRLAIPAAEKLYTDLTKFKKVKFIESLVESVKFNKQLNIKNVSFSYDKDQKNIFENINLTIEKNSITGIIGKTGSGKSTLLNLILGFYKPNKGTISIDDKNILDFENIKSLYNLIGLVPQDVFIYDDTLLNNIILNNTSSNEYDEKLLNDTLKNSELLEFVASLENGIHTSLGESGDKISGGQKQRIGIARCLFKKKQILILDEATNSLDKSTEEKIFNNLKKLKNEKTIIVVSHDYSVIDNCDSIYKIEDHKVKKN